MDEWIRKIFEASDLHDAQYEAWQAQQEQRLETRSADADLIFKRRDNARVLPRPQPQPQPQPQSAATMDDATQRRWDRWCDRRIKRMIEGPLKETIAQVLVHERKAMREHVAAAIAKLRSAELENDDDKVLEWPTKKQADVA